uniref:Alkane hydroxylase MAH1-like n=2 Tax=Cicer arietinum TaxID=3827 RepID=A0A1S2Z240_CICAR|nr:alkane hydroxylase MAH1-like [Cicer arietinum]
MTSDAMNVHHLTSKNFSNYGKGSDFHEIFDILGGGIFNLDSDEWKHERTLLHSLLKRKNIEIFIQQNIKKKLEKCLLPFLDNIASKPRQVLDLQDILERFTFDLTCNLLFGFDPNSLPYKFNDELSDVAYVKAISIIEAILMSRHYIPKSVWKLQKWLQIGKEMNYKSSQESLDKFLYKCISYCKDEEEQRKFNSSEDVDESQSCLVKSLMEESLGKGKMDDKYLRDTAFNLLAAGNGTISASLCWLFWLVSTHPVIEAKIIQEMKDNCVTQEENWIQNISMEKLEKLVYIHGAICEALRLYPPIPSEHKCAKKSDILPSGDHVSPNTKVMYSMYAMGRMEQIWGKDCMEFKPERWISDKGVIIQVPSYKFIAFNAGPRSCLGKDMTFVHMKMIATAMLWKFHFHVVEPHRVTPKLSMVLRMEHGFKVKVNARSI